MVKWGWRRGRAAPGHAPRGQGANAGMAETEFVVSVGSVDEKGESLHDNVVACVVTVDEEGWVTNINESEEPTPTTDAIVRFIRGSFDAFGMGNDVNIGDYRR